MHLGALLLIPPSNTPSSHLPSCRQARPLRLLACARSAWSANQASGPTAQVSRWRGLAPLASPPSGRGGPASPVGSRWKPHAQLQHSGTQQAPQALSAASRHLLGGGAAQRQLHEQDGLSQ